MDVINLILVITIIITVTIIVTAKASLYKSLQFL